MAGTFVDLLQNLLGASGAAPSGGSFLPEPASPAAPTFLATGGGPGATFLPDQGTSPVDLVGNILQGVNARRGALQDAAAQTVRDALAKKQATQQSVQNASQPGTTPPASTPTTSGASAPGPSAFYQQHLPYAQQALQDAGWNPDLAPIMVGIAANETGHGNPQYTVGHNYFGIKATGGEPQTPDVGTWEVGPQGAYSTQAAFRSYGSPQESYADFIRFLQDNPRYAGALQQQSSPTDFLRGVAGAGYATDPQWADKVLSLARNAATAGAPTGPAAPLRGVSQNDLGLSPEIAAAFCGPSAAIAFARATGRSPSPIEAMNLARQRGWNPTTGMAGPQSEVQLLNDVGVPAYLEPVNWQKVQAEALAGRGAILSSPGARGHYFQVLSANPQTGDLLLGDAVGANRWVQPQAIGSLNYGTPDYAIYRR